MTASDYVIDNPLRTIGVPRGVPVDDLPEITDVDTTCPEGARGPDGRSVTVSGETLQRAAASAPDGRTFVFGARRGMRPDSFWRDIPKESYFGDGYDADFWDADDLRRVGNALIEHYPEFAHLRDAEIRYRWKKSGGTSAGAANLGYCQKLSGLARHALQADFLVWLAADHLRELRPTAWHIEAMMFHELLHAGFDEENEKFIPIAHEFEGFRAELETYGAWQSHLTRAQESFKQARLVPVEPLGGWVSDDGDGA